MAIPRTADVAEAASAAPQSRARTALLGGVIALALVLRLWGIAWQLPHVMYSDELKYVLPAAAGESYVDADDEPEDYRNSWFFHHLLEIEYRVLAALLITHLDDQPGARPDVLGRQILIARVTVALLGAVAVVLIYAVGRRAFGVGVGLVAGALLAVNGLQIHLSHFALNDIPAHVLMVAALLASAEQYHRPRPLGFVMSGVLAGLAAAAKYNYGIVVLVPLVVLAVHARRSSVQNIVHFGALLGIGCVAGFLIGMPEALWAYREMLEDMHKQSTDGNQRWDGQDDAPVYLQYAGTLLRSFGFPALMAAAVGLVLLLWRQPRLGLALTLCPVLYLAYMASKATFFSRFALPLVPFVCLFAAYALVAVWSTVVAPRWRTLTVVAGCLLVLGPPAVLGVRMNQLTGRPDTRVEARSWVEANVPAGSRLALQTYSLPFTADYDVLRDTYRIRRFVGLGDDREFVRLACGASQYVMISSYMWDRQQMTSRGREPTGYELLEQHGQLLRTFDQGSGYADVPLDIDDVGIPFWHTERYARPGPTIKIYQLPADVCERVPRSRS